MDQATQKYPPALSQQLNSYKNEDPAPRPALAVPISVPHHILKDCWKKTSSPLKRTVGDLCNIAFYFLLRVGEYTSQGGTRRRRTERFRIKDVLLRRKDGSFIPNTAPLSELYKAKTATLCITNQKNGVKGQCISLDCTGSDTSPIRSLARRVYHIVSKAPLDLNPGCITISTYFDSTGPKQVRPRHINSTIKRAVVTMKMDKFGFTPNLVSSHSFRAGGAMALKLNGVDPIVIKKQGRWSSNTFMMYIHEQISALSEGLATKMSSYIPFANMGAAPRVSHVADELDTPQ